MKRILIQETPSYKGKSIVVKGWVNNRRDHGKLIFIDLRDRSGILQIVFSAMAQKTAFATAATLKNEFVVVVTGLVKLRAKSNINPELPTGTIELQASKIEILNEATTPVFEISKAHETNEELRMQYRYLDMRSQQLKNNLMMRHKIVKLIRDDLDAQGFWEIETPYLTKGTPEGAREFIVPARLSPGKFYVLPQSPQQFKQLLMVGGIEKYFQFARCFRDEDTRGDRQAEFTQLDIEMSFVEAEDVINVNEKLLIDIVKKLYPEKKIQTIPFPRLTFKETMAKYGTDKPDLRKDKTDPNLLAFCWIDEFPMFEKNDRGWTFTHNPFSAPIKEHQSWLTEKKNIGQIIASQYDIVFNGYELGGGSIRTHRSADLRNVLEIIGNSEQQIKDNFGTIIQALDFGAPPHGGIAWGLDRLVMVLQNEPSIRDVMAFPKTGDCRDLLMDAPSKLSAKTLKDAGLTK
jgi:aspartyl-tRNA synthetase